MKFLPAVSLAFCALLLSIVSLAQTHTLNVTFNEGKIKVAIPGDKGNRHFFLETILPQTHQPGKTQVLLNDNNKVITSHTNRYFNNACIVTNTVTKTNYGLQWDVEIKGTGSPWTIPVETQLQWDKNEGTRFWTTWPNNQINPYAPNWQDPFETAPFQNLALTYGGESHWSSNAFSIPVATSFIESNNLALSFIQSLEDTILGLDMHTDSTGSIAYRHSNHRISNQNTIHIRHQIVLHESDWRGGMNWMYEKYKAYFVPTLPAANAIAGGGAYSSYEGALDTARYKNMSLAINWKASLDFPYMGMFIPPVQSDSQTWVRYKQRGETIGDGLASIQKLNNYSAHFKRMGFNTLSYFNVTEFGNAIVYPHKRIEQDDKNLWKNANDFLYFKLKPGMLRPASIMPDWDERPIFSNWENCVAMDPGDSTYQDFLMNQARLHIEKIPASAGICIDRMDWLRYYNGSADDKVSFVNQNTTRSLVLSWNELMTKLGPLMHENNKVIFCNPIYRRIDLMKQMDGFYDEYGNYPHSLNLCAQMAMFKPIIAWTTHPDNFQPNPDAYFQHHLFMGAFLTVPFPGNDHTITPDATIEKFYLDYGAMFNALKGRQWILTPMVIKAKDGNAKANIFKVEKGVVVPVIHGKDASANIVLNLPYTLLGKDKIKVKLLYPGDTQWVTMGTKKYMPQMELTIPLKRGCAMVMLE